eukprot:scaffold269914_cov27-Prasinocladus_malaysianus.AAC.1
MAGMGGRLLVELCNHTKNTAIRLEGATHRLGGLHLGAKGSFEVRHGHPYFFPLASEVLQCKPEAS